MINSKKQETRNKQISNPKFKTWRIILIIVVCLGFVGFLSLSYWYKTEGPARAVDYNTDTEIICEEPIPVGIAIDATIDFLDDVYQRYQGETVKNASEQVDKLMGVIAGNDGKVCDFNKECKAQVGTGGPDMTVGAKFLPGVPGAIDYTYTVPTCKLKEATGNPCPDLSPYVKDAPQTPIDWLNQANPEALTLEELAKSLTAQADNVHSLFAGKTAVIPAGLEQSGENVGDSISKVDLVKRYIDNVDKFWLTPNPQKNTCALSELDRKRIEQGKMGDKFPLQCMDALAKNMYAPKAWSEECQDECETFNQKCKDCLAECNGGSVYASLNCKIYSQKETYDKCAFIEGQSKKCCGKFCADGFNTQCKECLCASADPANPQISQEKCLDWICGGSKANWVCCHEEPIQNPAYYTYESVSHHPELEESDQNCGNSCTIATQEAAGSVGGYTGKGQIFLLSAYAEPCFREKQCTKQGSLAGLGTIAAYAVNLPAKTRIKFNAFTLADSKKVNGEKVWYYKNRDGNGLPVWKTIVENTQVASGLTYCVCDVGGDIKDHRIDIWLSSDEEANEFGMRFGEVEIVPEGSGFPECCKVEPENDTDKNGRHDCCDKENFKLAKCKTPESPVGVVCEPENLQECHDDNIKEWKYLKPFWCGEYSKPIALKYLDRVIASLMFWK